MTTDSSSNAVPLTVHAKSDLARKAIKGFRRLSLGIVVSAGAFLTLLFYFQLFGELEPLHNSISHYYHENETILAWLALAPYGYHGIGLGDILVGTLSAIAVFLIWFSGFSKWEDRLLSFGGAVLLGVAWIPTGKVQNVCDSSGITIHFVCAILFFLAILLVATAFAHRREDFSEVMATTPSYRKWFAISGVMMVLVPSLIWLANKIGGCGYFLDWVFWAEWTAIFFFGVYWTGKMFEFNKVLLDTQINAQSQGSGWWAR